MTFVDRIHNPTLVPLTDSWVTMFHSGCQSSAASHDLTWWV